MKNYYTELEIKVMKVLSKPNGNGEMIGIVYVDYINLYDFGIDNKILRGLLSYLVKKDIIRIYGKGAETAVELTAHGFHLLANYLYLK